MKRPFIVASFLMFFAAEVQAGPKHWIQNHKRFLAIEGAALAGVGIHAVGLHHCRGGNVERCDEGYGSARAFFGIVSATNTVIMPAVAEGCWKDNPDAKFCHIFAWSGSAAQAGWGIYEWRHYHAEKMDLRSFGRSLSH